MKPQKLRAKILCAHKVGVGYVRMAIQVNRGKDVERVAIIDVKRVDETSPNNPRPRSDEEMQEAGMERAMFPSFGVIGTIIVGTTLSSEIFDKKKR
jgi:hypothetical protein